MLKTVNTVEPTDAQTEAGVEREKKRRKFGGRLRPKIPTRGSLSHSLLDGNQNRHLLAGSRNCHQPSGSRNRHQPSGSRNHHQPSGSRNHHLLGGSRNRHQLSGSRNRHLLDGSRKRQKLLRDGHQRQRPRRGLLALSVRNHPMML